MNGYSAILIVAGTVSLILQYVCMYVCHVFQLLFPAHHELYEAMVCRGLDLEMPSRGPGCHI